MVARSTVAVLVFLGFGSTVFAQAGMVVTRDEFLDRAEVSLAVTMQTPPDVNQAPLCNQLDLPCEGSGRTMPDFGLALSVAGYLNNAVAVVGEADIYANMWMSHRAGCGPVNGHLPVSCEDQQTNHVRSALGGLRARTALMDDGRTRGRFFGQVLVGTQWSTMVPTRLAIQPGAGGDAYLRSGLIIHVAYDFCWVPGEGRNLSTGRLVAGVAIPIGERYR